MKVVGVDFTAAPSKRKPIVLARGVLEEGLVRNVKFLPIENSSRLREFLHEGNFDRIGIDAPFSLPQEFLRTLGLSSWGESIQWAARLEKAAYFDLIRAFVQARPAGSKEPKRACDQRLSAASPLKLFNPGVGWMHYALAKQLVGLEACVLPFAKEKNSRAIFEVYPGAFARGRIGKASYKNDPLGDQERPKRRLILLAALGNYLQLNDSLTSRAVSDPNGDYLDALIALAQSAFSVGEPIPEAESREGWIFGADL